MHVYWNIGWREIVEKGSFDGFLSDAIDILGVKVSGYCGTILIL